MSSSMSVLEALSITLGFDASAVIKGAKDAVDSTKKLKEQTVKDARDTEDGIKSILNTVRETKLQILGLMAAFTGSQGMRAFAEAVTTANAALGRLATNLQSSPETLSAWQGAAEQIGGTATATAGSIQGLSDRLQELRNTGNTGILTNLMRVQAFGGTQLDLQHGVDQLLPGLADNLHRIAETQGAAKASWFGRQLGIDDATVNLLMKGRAAVTAMLEEQRRLGVVTRKQTEDSSELQKSWIGLQQAASSLGRTVLTSLTPYLVPLLDAIKNLIVLVKNAAEAHQNWTAVVSAMFILWTGSKFIGFLTNLWALRGAIVAIGAASRAAMAGGLLAFLSANPWIAGIIAGAAVMTPTPAGEGETEALHRRNERYGRRPDGGHNRPGHHAGGGRNRPGHHGGGAGHAQRSANADAIVDELRKAGLPDEAVAAALGSMQTESGLNPAVPQNSYNRGHNGLIQWDSQRWPKVKRWIESQGGNPWDARWQARAFVAEGRAKPGDPIYDGPRTAQGFREMEGSGGNLDRAVHGMGWGIERFGGGEEGGRGANARAWLSHLRKPNLSYTPGQPMGLKSGGYLGQHHAALAHYNALASAAYRSSSTITRSIIMTSTSTAASMCTRRRAPMAAPSLTTSIRSCTDR